MSEKRGHVRDNKNRIVESMKVHVRPHYVEIGGRDFSLKVKATKDREIRITLDQKGKNFDFHLGDIIITPNSIWYEEWDSPYSKPITRITPIWPVEGSIAKAGREGE